MTRLRLRLATVWKEAALAASTDCSPDGLLRAGAAISRKVVAQHQQPAPLGTGGFVPARQLATDKLYVRVLLRSAAVERQHTRLNTLGT